MKYDEPGQKPMANKEGTIIGRKDITTNMRNVGMR
jgi:hypothetical protein